MNCETRLQWNDKSNNRTKWEAKTATELSNDTTLDVSKTDDGNKVDQPDDLPFDADADFLLWTVGAVEDAAASVGGGLTGFFAPFLSFDGKLSPLRLIVYGNSSELVNVTLNTH